MKTPCSRLDIDIDIGIDIDVDVTIYVDVDVESLKLEYGFEVIFRLLWDPRIIIFQLSGLYCIHSLVALS